MHDRRDSGYDRRGSRYECGPDERHSEHHDDRCCHEHNEGCGPQRHSREDCCDERRDDRRAPRGDGPDTRFLQLEMSQLLYGEAEAVTRQAFREVLLEATKARLRERFGEKIAGLARLAIDELMNDVLANLDIEVRIQERNRARAHAKERVRDVFGERGSGRDARDTQADKSPHREGEAGERKRNEDPGPGRDENR